MEITEKVLKKENACTIIAESSTVLTDALKQKTKTTLLNLVQDGIKYFYFGFLGDFEKFCVEELRGMQKKFVDIRIICIRYGGEPSFTQKEADFIEKNLRQEGFDLSYTVFDAVKCADKKVFGVIPAHPIDRNREMLENSSVAIFCIDFNAKTSDSNNPFLNVIDNAFAKYAYKQAKNRFKLKIINLIN